MLQFNPQICIFSALFSCSCVAPLTREEFAEAVKTWTPMNRGAELVCELPLDSLHNVDQWRILDTKAVGDKRCILLSSTGYLQAHRDNPRLAPITALPQLSTDNALGGRDFALSTVQLARLLLSEQQVEAYELLSLNNL